MRRVGGNPKPYGSDPDAPPIGACLSALSYLMRDFACYESDLNEFLVDLCAYCNQPSFFKNMDFETFLHKRLKDESRIARSLKIWNDNNKD